MKKKNVIAILALSVVLVLSGCSKGTVKNTETAAETETITTEAIETEVIETEATESEVAETESSETASERDTINQSDFFSRGEKDGQSFVNEKAKIAFTLPDNWEYASDEDFKAALGTGVELLSERLDDYSEEDIQKAMETQVIYDVMAVNPENGSNIIVCYENLGIAGLLSGFTADDYLDKTVEQLADTNMFDIAENYETMMVGSQEYQLLTAEVIGTEMKQYYCVRKDAGYIISMIFTINPTDEFDAMAECFM